MNTTQQPEPPSWGSFLHPALGRLLPREAATRDALIILLVCLIAFLIGAAADAYENLIDFAATHEDWEIDEFFVALFITPIGLGIYAGRRLQETRREVRRREEAEEAAMRIAVHDALTGLPNRRRLNEEIGRALARAARGAQPCGLLMVDLDRFKPVNDLHGHLTGDRLLQEVAKRLVSVTREGDMVARLGGDEFAVIATLGDDDPLEDATRLARRLIAALEPPFQLGDVAAQIGCSIGIALAPQDATDREELMRRADLALYRAKAEGRGCFRFFEETMDARVRERALLEADLRLSIARGELVPYFQPLVEISSNRLIGFEMLARWPHATRGMVPPTEFVAIAEDTGLIVPMAELLLRKAARAAADWPQDLTLAVNVSALQLRDGMLPQVIESILRESGLPPSRVEVELTETALIGNIDVAQKIIRDLKAIGVRLALDDFGTGYSSLAYLQALPFDKIKIDAGFVRSMTDNADSRKIVAAVVGLGHSLGLPTVAEGVEDERQVEALSRLGCDVGQGWLFGRPMPLEEVRDLLRDVERKALLPARMAPADAG